MRARTRDRAVYLAAHPFLFALLAATRHRPVLRLGRTVLVHDDEAFTAALTRLPLDRTAAGTTGGAVSALTTAGALFDQQGEAHRQTRRASADLLSATGVATLRPLWTDVMKEGLRPLATGAQVDLVPLAAQIAGATALALLSADDKTQPRAPATTAHEESAAWALAQAARAAAAATAREHLPGLFRGQARAAARTTASHLTALVAPDGGDHAGLHAMLAVAAINTTVAALPRAAAWAADDNLWDAAAAEPATLADELLRVLAPTPLLPRAAAADGDLPPGCPVHAGDRLMLIARHAAGAHRSGPDPASPSAPQTGQLVFGIGPHACPGARLARTQMADWLTALAPYRPVVTRARPDCRSALPSWATLVIQAGTP
ncbi:cytochrome P450 [Actinoplanes sp. NBRC 103695]|uniref:cytochrome P450 n=1 Tax=Actinoplanes sp. NBRC 103695 TaxID=3032202 RepID=UPI0024A01BD0|nr:cytochrome P450 [Actinoplanes sp. NBRC 103695]GLY95902.1 hypothetical protein Acsp02_31570 [Actinoplanes sp. NBRC 103695]